MLRLAGTTPPRLLSARAVLRPAPPRTPSVSVRAWSLAIKVWCCANKQTPPTLRVGRCGCDSLSLAGSRQRVKSLSSKVRLRLDLSTVRLILSRIVLHSAIAPFQTNLPRARRKARLFPLVRDSPAESLRYRYAPIYVRARRSECFSAPGSARFSHPVETCLLPAFSAESSEPSGKKFLRHSLPPVSAAFTAPTASSPHSALKPSPPPVLPRS